MYGFKCSMKNATANQDDCRCRCKATAKHGLNEANENKTQTKRICAAKMYGNDELRNRQWASLVRSDFIRARRSFTGNAVGSLFTHIILALYGVRCKRFLNCIHVHPDCHFRNTLLTSNGKSYYCSKAFRFLCILAAKVFILHHKHVHTCRLWVSCVCFFIGNQLSI